MFKIFSTYICWINIYIYIMQRLEVSFAVRPIYVSLGVKRLSYANTRWKTNRKFSRNNLFSEILNLNNIMGLKRQSSPYHILQSVLLFITSAVWRCNTRSVYLPCCLTLLSVSTCWCTLHCNDSSARCAFFNTVCDRNKATKVQLCAEFVNVWITDCEFRSCYVFESHVEKTG